MKIGIVDIGIGNTRSISNVLNREGISNEIIYKPDDLSGVDKMILPGVGSFDPAVRGLQSSGFRDRILEKVSQGTHLLGICVGAQLLYQTSEEGDLEGLGLINGTVLKFQESDVYKVPHMGWNTVTIQRNIPLIQNLDLGERFYFAHSYFIQNESNDNSIAKTIYNVEFDAIVNKDNVSGVQFHPEKSHSQGIKLLLNFAGSHV
jgi:glutamine amidotransferase